MFVEAIAALRHRFEADNHQVSYGHTGDRFTPEQEVGKRLERAYQVVRAFFTDLMRIQLLQPTHEMEYRQVGRTELRVSAVGIGTCQFQVLPERQAEPYIVRALAESGRAVVVASQGFDVGNCLHRRARGLKGGWEVFTAQSMVPRSIFRA